MMAAGTVLVVDDDAAIQGFVTAVLEEEGYRVVHAVDGAGVTIAGQERPALILLDMMMPEMDGVEVSRRLRADPATAAIPIIGMSAYGGAPPPGLQADAWLDKPFEIDQLVEIVATWIQTP